MAGVEDTRLHPRIDPHSPYYLGSSDNPGTTITNIVFRGDNYEEWARSMRLSLQGKHKFGFIDGTITKPTDTNKLDDWVCPIYSRAVDFGHSCSFSTEDNSFL